ncbi:hypothetical protein AHAS_Ahas16G0017800 [Arachis hypogaea]
MGIAAAAVVVPFGLLFFTSGLAVNLIQAVSYVLVRPLSKNLHRRINRVVAELLWLELVWLIDWWAGVKVEVFTDHETFQLMGKEHALVICNHRSDIDWLVGWVLAQRSGCLGSTLAVMKKSSKFLPDTGRPKKSLLVGYSIHISNPSTSIFIGNHILVWSDCYGSRQVSPMDFATIILEGYCNFNC